MNIVLTVFLLTWVCVIIYSVNEDLITKLKKKGKSAKILEYINLPLNAVINAVGNTMNLFTASIFIFSIACFLGICAKLILG